MNSNFICYNKSMANKITQLVNESGDNLYPLAGGMASDSITTAMLKDNSVTSDKIDSATLVYTGTGAFTGGTGVTLLDTCFAIKNYNNCMCTIRFSVTSTTSGDHPLATLNSNFPLPYSIPSLGNNQLVAAIGYLGTAPILCFMHTDSRQIDFRVLSSTQISSLTYGAVTFNYISEW